MNGQDNYDVSEMDETMGFRENDKTTQMIPDTKDPYGSVKAASRKTAQHRSM